MMYRFFCHPLVAVLCLGIVCGFNIIDADSSAGSAALTENTGISKILFDPKADVYCLQEYALFLPVYEKHLMPDKAWQKSSEFLRWEDVTIENKEKEVWVLFSVKNESDQSQVFYLNGQLTDYADLYQIMDNQPELINSTGYLVPFHNRPVLDWGTIINGSIPGKSERTYLFRLKSVTRNSRYLIDYALLDCMKLYTQSGYEDTYKLRRRLTYFFLGAIFLMFIYNLCISIITLYREYFLVSLYNISTVLTCLFITEAHLEIGLMNTFDWIRNIQYIFLSLIPLSYSWFSIKFLDIRTNMPSVYKVLKGLSGIYLVIIICLIFSYYRIAFLLATVTTVVVFLLVLYVSACLSKNTPSARFLFLGSIMLGVLGILNVLNLFKLVSTSVMVNSSYTLQMVEILFFSFAVAFKLRITKKTMHIMRHKNEIQRERLRMEETMRRQLEMENNQKARSLTATSIQLLNFNEKLTELVGKIRVNVDSSNNPDLLHQVVRELTILRQSENQWNNIKVHFENLNPHFFSKLDHHFPNLSLNDHKLLTFLKMKLSNKEIAIILNVTIRAVEQSKRRVKKKLGMNPDDQDITGYVESKTASKNV